MDTHIATDVRELRARRSARARAVLALGPLTVLAGVVWALVQPHRLTLLNPQGEGFWALVVEAPLLVIAVGVVFHVLVARGIVEDVETTAPE
jgi:hypothetical protein